jgi:hypothetical protein
MRSSDSVPVVDILIPSLVRRLFTIHRKIAKTGDQHSE